MIERYTLPEMGTIWSESRRLATYQEVQALAAEAWAKLGVVPAHVAEAIRTAPAVDPVAIREREAITQHDVAAFVDLLAGSVAEGGEWVHYGLTSSDMIDTAQGVILAASADQLIARTKKLFDAVKRQAFEHQSTVMVGRTHGIWAEPTSFGLKLASWAFELERTHQRLHAAREMVAVGKVSGAVGTYAHVPPSVEEHVCTGLGLAVEPASTQVTGRDRHAHYLSVLALVGASLERFATEIRNLQRSEIGEVMEAFGDGQKGSSAMPHKRNPVLSENVTGLARLLRGYAQVGFENVALWHERDISHSSAERVVLPDASIVADFALARMTGIVEGLIVNSKRMAANLEATGGLVFSQRVLLSLVESGMSREGAYHTVQRIAAQAWEEGTPFHQLLADDPAVGLSDTSLNHIFDTTAFLRNAQAVFARLEGLTLS
ncbi:MAG: adenylosuccinate lyase [Acidimicrobiia bacterium]|nr:adenylosuccinate lyase [Acidimicrobiia bacterium]